MTDKMALGEYRVQFYDEGRKRGIGSATFGRWIVRVREAEHHRHRFVSRVGDHVPDARRDVEGRAGAVRHDRARQAELALARYDKGELLRDVGQHGGRGARRKAGEAERSG